MKKPIYLFVYLSIYLSVSLNGQVLNSKEIGKGTGIQRNISPNLDKLKVRWKKAALENCPAVSSVTNTAPGVPTGGVATVGNAPASVAFVAPANTVGSAVSFNMLRSNTDNITATGATSPINMTGLTHGTAYTFTVVATNADGNQTIKNN